MSGLRVSTIGDLIDGGYTLDAWCPACRRGARVDLEALDRRYGRDATYIKPRSPIRLRCAKCGAAGCDSNIGALGPYSGQ